MYDTSMLINTLPPELFYLNKTCLVKNSTPHQRLCLVPNVYFLYRCAYYWTCLLCCGFKHRFTCIISNHLCIRTFKHNSLC